MRHTVNTAWSPDKQIDTGTYQQPSSPHAYLIANKTIANPRCYHVRPVTGLFAKRAGGGGGLCHSSMNGIAVQLIRIANSHTQAVCRLSLEQAYPWNAHLIRAPPWGFATTVRVTDCHVRRWRISVAAEEGCLNLTLLYWYPFSWSRIATIRYVVASAEGPRRSLVITTGYGVWVERIPTCRRRVSDVSTYECSSSPSRECQTSTI